MGVQDGWIDATFTAGLRVSVAEFRRIAYLTNGWDYMRRFQGLWARRNEWSGSNEFQEVPYAGIEGPGTGATIFTTAPSASAESAAGAGWDTGTHTFRWRWYDESTGWVSNPSNELEVTVAADKQLTFTISAAVGSGNIYRPSDLKVTHYALEATIVSGSTFYLVALIPVTDEAGNFTTTYAAEATDAFLAASGLEWEDDGHDVPPVKKHALVHRGRLFLYGDVVYSEGTVATTINSQTVTGTGTLFRASALGTASTPPIAGRRFFRSGTFEYYEIESYDSTTQLTLAKEWGSSSESGAAFEIVGGNGLIYFSRENSPESFPPLNWFGLPTSAAGGNVTAAAAFDQSVIFFTTRTAHRFSWVSDPGEDGQFYPLPGTRGAFSPRVVVVQESTLFAWDHQGAWVYQGGVPIDVSRPIAADLADLDYTYSHLWHAVYLPASRAVRWYVTATGETEPKSYFQLDAGRLASGSIVWTTGNLDVACTESHLGWIDRDSPLYVLLGDENSYLWRGDVGTVDGGGAYHHLTATAGATTLIVPVTDVLPTDGTLRGVAATWVQASGVRETRVVSGHSASAIYLATAFSGTPATGDKIWLGRIRALLKTRSFYSARSDSKRGPRYLRIFWTPLSSTRYLLVRAYAANSSTAQSWGVASWRRAINPTPPGKNASYAATDFLVDLSDTEGRIDIPLGSEASWCEAYELEVEEPDVALEIHLIEIDGVESPSPE